MIYSNASGTVKPSFQIGPRGIAISSTAVIQDPTHLLKGFRKATVSGNGRTNTLVYDIEIPSTLLQSCEPDPNDPNVYIITLFDRATGATREIVINAGLGNSGVAFSGETAAEDNLAAFSDNTGRYIKDSGYSVYTSSFGEGAENENDKVPTVSAVYEYVGELTDYLKDRINGKL